MFVGRKKPARIKKARVQPRVFTPKPKKPKKPAGRPGRPAAPKREERPVYRGPPMVLRPFQREGVNFLKKHDYNVLLADAPGCGKTPQVLSAIKENHRELCPALIVVPASVVLNWRNEAERWIPGVRVGIVDQLTSPLEPADHLTVTTWDMLASRSLDFRRHGFRYLVCDEAHYAKNPEALRSQGLRDVAQVVKRVTLLTGTPLVNKHDELTVLKLLIDPKEGDPPMLRRLLENVAPDIPEKRRIILRAEIPDNIRHEYSEVVEVYEEWLSEYLPKVLDNPASVDAAVERASKAQSLSKLSYLRRILGRGKVPAAAAWAHKLVKQGEQVVIFGQYVDVLDILGQALSRLGITYVRLDGATPQEQRQAAVEAFQKKEVNVFIGSQAAREGITLTNACNLLFLERWWTPAAEEQAEDRIRRIGQTRPTTIWYLHAEDTLDDRIEVIVERKRQLASRFIGTATIESTEHGEVWDLWRRISSLRGGVPLVAVNPKGQIDFPSLPPAKYIYAVTIASALWPSDAVQRHLRKGKHRIRKTVRDETYTAIQTRSIRSFVKGSIKRKQIAKGLWVDFGTPKSKIKAMRAWKRIPKKKLPELTAKRTKIKRIKRTRRSKIKLS